MGTVAFYPPEATSPERARALNQLCLAGGYDYAPIPTRTRADGGKIFLSKDANESGYVQMPWPLPGLGAPVSMSSTLRERAEPYHLLIELARGTLNQVRTQVFEWELIGLAVPPEDREKMRSVSREFGKEVLEPQSGGQTDRLTAILVQAHRLADRVSRVFAEQLLATRAGETGKLSTAFGRRLSSLPDGAAAAEICSSFTAVRLAPEWRQIEPTEAGYNWTRFDELVDWACGTGLAVSIGPIIDLAADTLPDWVRQWSGDLPSLSAFLCDFTETLMRRYQDRVNSWHVFHGFNQSEVLSLGEDERLRLAARLLEAARGIAPDGLWTIGLAQPWGDYLNSEDHTYSPFVFADTLLRAGFGFATLELEIRPGLGRRDSFARNALELFRLLELFNNLGVPLEVGVWCPPGGGDLPGSPPDWAVTDFLLAAAMPQVKGVYWSNQYDPSSTPSPYDTPLCGESADTPPLIGEVRRSFIE